MLIIVLLEWTWEERKRIYSLKIDGQDELNPTEEPNWALEWVQAEGKTTWDEWVLGPAPNIEP